MGVKNKSKKYENMAAFEIHWKLDCDIGPPLGNWLRPIGQHSWGGGKANWPAHEGITTAGARVIQIYVWQVPMCFVMGLLSRSC